MSLEFELIQSAIGEQRSKLFPHLKETVVTNKTDLLVLLAKIILFFL